MVHKTIKNLIKKVKKFDRYLVNTSILTQIFFWAIIFYITYTFFDRHFISFHYDMFGHFLHFAKDLIIPLIIFFILIKFLLPEIDRLFLIEPTYKKGQIKKFIKEVYYILIFYLTTVIVLQFAIEKYIEWFTILGNPIIADAGLAATYALTITPLTVFFVRLSRNNAVFKAVLYTNVLLILFVWMIEIPLLADPGAIFDRLRVSAFGMFGPTIALAFLDILTPINRIKKWFKRKF